MADIAYVSTETIREIHDRIVCNARDSLGVLSPGSLDACAKRPQQAFYGHEPYRGLFLKAAVLMQSIIRFSPFADGNKRTAYASTMFFLFLNGYTLREPEDSVEITLRVAREEIRVPEIATWLMIHAKSALIPRLRILAALFLSILIYLLRGRK